MNQAWVPLVKRVLRQDRVTRSIAFVPDVSFLVLLDLGPHRLQHWRSLKAQARPGGVCQEGFGAGDL